VTADPIPDDAIFLHDRKCPVVEADASRIYVVLAFYLLELQAGMCRIAFEQRIGAFGILWNGGGKVGK